MIPVKTQIGLLFALLAPGEQLAGAVQKLPLPRAHLDRVNGVIGGDLLDRLAVTDRLHGDPGLELGAVGAALAQLLRRRLRLRWEPPLRGGAPPLRLTIGAVQESLTTSPCSEVVENLPGLVPCSTRWTRCCCRL